MFDEYDEGTAILPMSDDPPPTPREPGAAVKFFADPKLQEHPEVLEKSQVEMTFDATPPTRKIPAQNYLMRWEGQIVPPAGGEYTFQVEGAPGDSASLWIEGKKVLQQDRFDEGPAATASVTMTGGQPVLYRLDYTHATSPGTMRLTWRGPGCDREEVPASALVDAWGRFPHQRGSSFRLVPQANGGGERHDYRQALANRPDDQVKQTWGGGRQREELLLFMASLHILLPRSGAHATVIDGD